MTKIGRYPDYVNENAVRWIAGFTLCLALLAIFHPAWYTIIPLTLGFIVRFLYGPDYSPTAKLVTRVILPKLDVSYKMIPGNPKRFAQLIGSIFTISAIILFTTGMILEYRVLLGILSFFAFLESAFGFCAGCLVFGYLIRFGFVAEEICEKCSNINYEI